MKVTTRNARFQEWQALLANRSKRARRGEFLVQGVRPISLAIERGWTIRELLYRADVPLSRWADMMLSAAPVVAVAGELMRELGEKDDDTPELLAVVAIPPDSLSRIGPGPVVVFDRPTSPGNIGTLVRSADAFGAGGVIIAGHAADPYDPKAVRASTGSLFTVPVVRVPAPGPVLDWAAGRPIVGTDERGSISIDEHDFDPATIIVVGNETTGLSAAWREACSTMLRIPMVGAASSLNAATAASIVLYEAARRRSTVELSSNHS